MLRLLSIIQTERTRPSLWEAGFGRRLRGNANGEYILGGILLQKWNVSMLLQHLMTPV